MATEKEQAAMDHFNALTERCQWCGISRLGVSPTRFGPGNYLRTCKQCRDRLIEKRLIQPQ